jgi:hypothetical protein
MSETIFTKGVCPVSVSDRTHRWTTIKATARLRNPPAPAFTLQQVLPDLQRRVSNSKSQTLEFPTLRGEAGAAGDGGAMVFFRN